MIKLSSVKLRVHAGNSLLSDDSEWWL